MESCRPGGPECNTRASKAWAQAATWCVQYRQQPGQDVPKLAGAPPRSKSLLGSRWPASDFHPLADVFTCAEEERKAEGEMCVKSLGRTLTDQSAESRNP